MPSTHFITILQWNTVPDNSGLVFFEPYSISDTATTFDPLIARFNDSTQRISIASVFQVPENYDSSAQLIVTGTANASTGDMRVGLSYRTVSSGEDYGGAATSTATGTISKSATAFEQFREIIDLTSTDFARGDDVFYDLFRGGDDTLDTMAAAMLVMSARFRYLSTA